ncbi:hypothetical protein EG329_001788 [Mollisiaceae sp. DMI_Dod_QoI]|nr:hypothetical protein EG329_001788 [Helotiales sp. DMI_Dod_QoI]
MAEPLGIASSVISLVTIAAQISKLSYNLFTDLRNATKAQKQYLREVSALTEVLLRLEQAVEVAQIESLFATRPGPLSATILRDCQEDLKGLHARLDHEVGGRFEKLKTTLRWFFDERDVKKLIDMLHRYREIFVSAMSSNIFIISMATHNKLDELSRGVLPLLPKLSASEDHARIMKWLSSPKPPRPWMPIFDSICPGTGEWILSNESYTKWRDGPVSLLSLVGKPGAGKTFLVSVILNDLTNSGDSVQRSVVYHIFDYIESRDTSTTAVLQSIICQIVAQEDTSQISLLLQHCQKSQSPLGLKALTRVLMDVIVVKPNSVLVLDALDEFDDRGHLFPILRLLLKTGLRILVTSRSIPDIDDTFRGDITVEIEVPRSDIEAFVDYKLRESALYVRLNAQPSISSAIVNHSDGLFLFAKLLTQHLAGFTNIKQMRRALETFPSTLLGAYDSTLQRVLMQPTARSTLAMKTLGWIVHAGRRLRLDEITHGLAIEDDTSELDEDNITSGEIILQVCIGLVSLNKLDGTIGMVHATAYDFFQNLPDRYKGIQIEMAKACMTYLCFKSFANGSCKTVESFLDRTHAMPFYRYAAQNWGLHARRSEKEIMPLLFKVLNDSNIRMAAFQALQFREIQNGEVAAAVFKDSPTGLEPIHVAAYWNLSLAIETLFNQGVDLSLADTQGWTPLHWACSNGHLEAAKALLGHGAHIDAADNSEWTSLFWAVIKGHKELVDFLLQKGANSRLTDSNHWTVLHWATSKEDRDMVQLILQHCAKAKMSKRSQMKKLTVQGAKRLVSSTKHCEIPLEIAAERRDIDTFNVILMDLQSQGSENTFNVLWSVKGFDTPVPSLSAYMTKFEFLKVDPEDPFGTRWWNLNQQEDRKHDSWLNKLFWSAIRDGKADIVQLLIERGVDPNTTSDSKTEGGTALHNAARRKDPQVAEILIKNGVDPSITDYDGRTPLHIAANNGFEHVVDLLIRSGADTNAKSDNNTTPLMEACCHQSGTDPLLPLRLADLLIKGGADIDIRDEDGLTALHHTTSYGNYLTAKLLLDTGRANVQAKTLRGRTALHYAAGARNPQLIQLFIQEGCIPSGEDQDGMTPLKVLAERPLNDDGSPKEPKSDSDTLTTCLNLLLGSHGLPVSSERAHEDLLQELLHLALSYRDWVLFHLLAQRGAQLGAHENIKCGDLYCFMDEAIDHEVEVVRSLLKFGFSPSKSFCSLPVLVYLFRESGRQFESKVAEDPASKIEKLTIILDNLLEHGIDINAACEAGHSVLSGGHSALIEALEFKVLQKDSVKLLVDRGADVYHVVSGAWDALLHTTVYGNIETIRCILERAAKQPRADHWIEIEKWFPTEIQDDLDYICSNLERYKLIETEYISHGTLLQMAISQGNLELTSRLLQHGARIDVRDSSGWSVLHSATYDGHLEIVKVLLKYGAEVTCTSSEWQSMHVWPFRFPLGNIWKGQPIHLAAISRRYEIAKVLLAHGANVDAKVFYHENGSLMPGPTPLQLVLDTGEWYDEKRETLSPDLLKMAQLFLLHGADVSGAADKLKLEDIVRFEGFEDLWDTLNAGITED